jgi:hypothetical protein
VIKNGEKAVMKIYQRACGMADADYRSILAEVTAKNHHGQPLLTSTDPAFSHDDVDDVMCHLEATLELRVNAGQAEWPIIKGVRATPRYWRDKKGKPGTPSSRERFAQGKAVASLEEVMAEMATLGCGVPYCLATARRVTKDPAITLDRLDARQKRAVAAALARTARFKRRTAFAPAQTDEPF